MQRNASAPSTAIHTRQEEPHPRAAALWYAALGYPVFPCQRGAKAPATAHGFKDATTVPRRIRQLFRHGHNVGLAAPLGVLALDIDRDATQVLRMLEATFPEVEAAPLHATPSGGYHVFLGLPESAPRLVTGPWPRGATRTYGELRGMGRSYVVAPPSGTPGGRYRILRRLVAVNALPVASPGLLEYLSPPERRHPPQRPQGQRSGASSLASQLAAVRGAVEGTRNNTLNRSAFIAGLLIASGQVDEGTAREALLAAALDVGLPQREALATIASGLHSGQMKAHQTGAGNGR